MERLRNANAMHFINLKYFYDAVRLGSVSAAAKANHVTQSAISQGISKLEKSLGVDLVAHHPNRFRLTPDGETAFRQAADLLKQAAEFKDTLTKDSMGNLEIACTASFAINAMPPYLKRFMEAYPEVHVNFYMGRKPDLKQMLKTGVVDFGICPDEGELDGWEKREIFSGNFGFYVSSRLKKKEADQLGFILAESNCEETIHFRKAYSKIFAKEPKIAIEVNSWEMIANLTLEGLGIGYLPDYLTIKRKEDLKKFPLDISPFPYSICAFYPKGMHLRKSSETFLSYFS